jgi:hypothetical protein
VAERRRPAAADGRHREVAKFVDERLKKGAAIVERYRKLGKLNEQFVLGNQWGATTWNKGSPTVDEDQWFTAEGVPKLHVNLLAIIHMTWAALVTKNRQSARATQGTEDPEDAFNAELVNKIIEWVSREYKTADVFMQAAQFGFDHGTAGVKHCWDSARKRLILAPLTIFNVVLAPGADYKNARWYAFQNYLDEEAAIDLFEKVGITKKPKVEKYENSAKEELEGVVHVEFWHRPCRDFPRGMFASLVDGEVVELIEEWPYTLDVPGQERKLIRPL